MLLVERGGPPLEGWWSLPGGALETGETLEQGLCREVLEETGLVVRPIRVAEIFERIMTDPAGRPEYHYVLIDFLCRVTGGRLAPASDARGAAWVSRRVLGRLRLTQGTLDVIRRAFRNRKRGGGSRISGVIGPRPVT